MCWTQNASPYIYIQSKNGCLSPRRCNPNPSLKRTPCQLTLVCTGAWLKHQINIDQWGSPMIINAWAQTTFAIYGQLLFIHHARACHVCKYIMHVYTCHIYIHIFICRGPLHMCLTCYMIRTPRSSSTCSVLPQLRPWHLLPSRRCLLHPLLQPPRIPASLGVALFGVVSLSLYIICVCLFSLKSVFNTKIYIYI